MKTVSFKAGDAILKEGDEGDTAYLIIDGSVEITIGEGSKAQAVGQLGTGDAFGEMCLLEPGRRSATVTALADTTCATTSYDEFMDSIHNDPERAVQFMRTLIRRLRTMNEMMESMGQRRRGIRGFFDDWQKSLQEAEAGLSDEEKLRRREAMMMGYWM
ncbi:Crp/Fnr family transcriptional regulator [Bauldia sp.]|uniref:Crp/Fnr family transcriptional regulator n=1 Tax=Bauldia sp. TaxID=2575872 RepID=UPI003BAD795D